ncbi:hypothetical protein Tco_0289606 [Tanacetum coccineum]
MRSIISTVSISLEDFMSSILLRMVIIVEVVIVTVIWVVIFVNVIVGVVIIVAIIGVVVFDTIIGIVVVSGLVVVGGGFLLSIKTFVCDHFGVMAAKVKAGVSDCLIFLLGGFYQTKITVIRDDITSFGTELKNCFPMKLGNNMMRTPYSKNIHSGKAILNIGSRVVGEKDIVLLNKPTNATPCYIVAQLPEIKHALKGYTKVSEIHREITIVILVRDRCPRGKGNLPRLPIRTNINVFVYTSMGIHIGKPSPQ